MIKKRYKKIQHELIEKQLKKINNAIDKLFLLKIGYAEDYDDTREIVEILKKFKKEMGNRNVKD